jgi:hypothetical protein
LARRTVDMTHKVAERPTFLSDVDQLRDAQLLDRVSGWIWLEPEVRHQFLEGAWPFLQAIKISSRFG